MSAKLPSHQTLAKIIGIGGLFVVGANYLLTNKYQQRLRRTVTFQRVEEILHNNEKVMQYLGEPIKYGRIKFCDPEDNVRKFFVPVNGSNTTGELNCTLFLDEEIKPVISKLEIKFPDTIPNKLFMLYENEQ